MIYEHRKYNHILLLPMYLLDTEFEPSTTLTALISILSASLALHALVTSSSLSAVTLSSPDLVTLELITPLLIGISGRNGCSTGGDTLEGRCHTFSVVATLCQPRRYTRRLIAAEALSPTVSLVYVVLSKHVIEAGIWCARWWYC